MTDQSGKGGTIRRSIKRALRALAYAFLARWLQKHGIALPVEVTGILPAADPEIVSGAVNAGLLMGADKGLREKLRGGWQLIKAIIKAR